MAKKFLVAIAAIIGIMAALVILPGISRQGGDLAIEYHRDSIKRVGSGQYDIGERDLLTVSNDGSASLANLDDQGNALGERRFFVSSEDMKVLRELFLATGFMQIPENSYVEKTGLANFTRYQLTVKSGQDSQTISWVNPEAGSGNIPSIVINAGTRLDAIIQKQP